MKCAAYSPACRGDHFRFRIVMPTSDVPRATIPLENQGELESLSGMSLSEGYWYKVHLAMMDACCDHELRKERPTSTTERRFDIACAVIRRRAHAAQRYDRNGHPF